MTDTGNGVTRAGIGQPAADSSLAGWFDAMLLVVAVGYAGFIGFLSLVNQVQLTPDVIVVALGFAVVLVTRTRTGLLREWTPFLLLFLAYELMRGLADDAGLPVHVSDVVAVERALFGGALPTAVLQSWWHPASGVDLLAVVGTVVYMLHFPLPLVTGIVLWRWRRDLFHPYLVALILLSFAGFVTYLLLPVAPPWMAAEQGRLAAPPGEYPITYLKPDAFVALTGWLGLPGKPLYDLTFMSLNANEVAAFPSLHAGYPFLTFLVVWRAFGRVGWIALGYAILVSVTVVYTADHWVVDVLAGVAYAVAAYLFTDWLVRRRHERVALAGSVGPAA